MGFFMRFIMAKHVFTGVFIPAKIWIAKDLIPQEKMMLAEIKALSEDSGWCFAGNKHFADWLVCGTSNISNYIQRFQRDGMIEVTYKDKKTFSGRRMRVNLEWFHGLATPYIETETPYTGNVPPYTGNVPPYTGNVPPYTGNVTERQFKATSKEVVEEGAEKSEILKETHFEQMEVPPAAPIHVELHDRDLPGTTIHDEVPAPSWRPFNITEAAADLKADQLCRDKFGKDMNLTMAKATEDFPVFVDEFVSEQIAFCNTYNKVSDFRKHFYYWSLTAPKAKAAANRPAPGSTQQNRPAPSALPLSLQNKIGK